MPKSSSFISHLNFAEPTFNSPIFAQSQTDKTWLFVLKQKLELGIIPIAVLKKLLSMIKTETKALFQGGSLRKGFTKNIKSFTWNFVYFFVAQ